MGNGGVLLWSLLAATLVGGFAFPRFARVISLGLGLPPLVMAPWTAPRGENDGLWVLIVPMLAVFVAVLIATAAAGSRIRGRLAQRAG